MAGVAGLAASQVLGQVPDRLSVVELRQYTLKGGRRSQFIDLFEREFITTQAAVGSYVLGIFRDLDDPDRFVWLRGFKDMESRKDALQAFYFGPVWKAHREVANSMIVDSDNVLLLHPVGPALGLLSPPREQVAGVVRVSAFRLRDVDPGAFAKFFGATMRPLIRQAGGQSIAELGTETAENTFPRLPVRERDPLFIWMSRFATESAERQFDQRLSRMSGWRDDAPPEILPALMLKPEVLRLAPTRLSPLK